MKKSFRKNSTSFIKRKIQFFMGLSAMALVSGNLAMAQTTVSSTISTGSDDMEEYVSTGAVSATSSDLEMITETSAQLVGLRFTGVNVPKGATISSAYLQFTCDETGTGATTLTIKGQAADNPSTFSNASFAVSSRAKGTASVNWTVASWSTVDQRSTAQRSPDLKTVVQEIVNRTGWNSGNAMALIINGTGKRVADAYEGGAAKAATLTITYTGGITPPACTSIGCFTSVQPSAQSNVLVLPSTHTFQMLFKQGNTYSVGGTIPGGHDFTGYVPISGSSTNGYVSVNHENSPGAVSILNVNYNATSKLWNVSSSGPVTWNSSQVVKTERNCSGGVTPWGTVITAEETRNTGDANGDGYTDTGWLVEIDPATKSVKQYGNGKAEKLWAAGRMSHENACVASDNRTMYYGEDDPSGRVYKFVANTAGNLYSGTLYVLKLNSALSSGEPTTTVGSWVQVPNATQSDRNNTYSLAASLGGTVFNGVEDVEIGPNGQIYFTSKGNGRVYRFTDGGTSVSNFQTFVGGMSYTINYGSGSVSEAWGTGNDNLAFDGEGNLWVQQDGGRGHLWVVRPTHTQSSPKVELFAKTPSGSESTGLTFSPDKKFMFLSIQHPSSTNVNQTDASGSSVRFNAAATIVIARKENLGTGAARVASLFEENTMEASKTKVFPNPFRGETNVVVNLDKTSSLEIAAYDKKGNKLSDIFSGSLDKGEHTFNYASSTQGDVIIKTVIDGTQSESHQVISY